MEFSTAQNWLGIGAGIVVTMLAMAPIRAWMRGSLLALGILLMGIGVWRMVTGSRSGSSGEKPTAPITQSSTGPNSPNVVGDNPQFNFNLEQKPWGLTDDQRRKLTAALNKVPPGTVYKLRISFLGDCDQCARYAHDLGETWYGIPGWEVQVADLYGLSIRLQGVFVITDGEGCPPEALALAIEALEAAGIAYVKDQTRGKYGSDSCAVIVANKPQE